MIPGNTAFLSSDQAKEDNETDQQQRTSLFADDGCSGVNFMLALTEAEQIIGKKVKIIRA